MPPLEDLRDLVNEPGLDTVLERLAAAGIRSDRDVLLGNDRDLAAKCNSDVSLIKQLKEHLAETHAAPFRRGREVLESLGKLAGPSSNLIRTFGCEGIDAMLDGGIQFGDIIELCGSTSQGKTQLCLFVLICSIVLQHERYSTSPAPPNPRDVLGTAIYIDTSNSFTPHRVLEFFNGSDRFSAVRAAGVTNEDVLSRVRVASCFDSYSLLHILGDLDTALSKRSTAFHSRLQTLIIDSVGSLLAPLNSKKQGTGMTLMASIGRMLRAIATTHGVALVIINHAVSDRGGGPRSVKPALGMSWIGLPTVRLFLRHDGEEDTDEQTGGREGMVWTFEAADGRVMRLCKRLIEVRNSVRTNVSARAAVYIGQTEIICE